jgi:hypothetical protein
MPLGILAKDFKAVRVPPEWLSFLVEAFSQKGGGRRWIFVQRGDGRYEGYFPPTGEEVEVMDWVEFLLGRGESGILFSLSEFENFLSRLPDGVPREVVGRFAGFLAPLLPDLYEDLQGFSYNFRPSSRNQIVVDTAKLFFPKGKGVYLLFPYKGKEIGLVFFFNNRGEIQEVFGVPEGNFPAKKVDGKEIYLGIRISDSAFHYITSQRSLKELGKYLSSGDILLDPVPVPLRVALKARRLFRG